MATKKQVRLPNKPSKLIRLALTDLEKVEKSKKYTVYMNTWHLPSHMGCYVCFAGAVMAMSLRSKPGQSVQPTYFPPSQRKKLEALDCFRRGEVESGLLRLGIKIPKSMRVDFSISPYSMTQSLFKDDMKKMSDYFESFGL